MRRFPGNDFSVEGIEVGFWTGETWAAETDELWRPAVGLYGVTLEGEHFAGGVRHLLSSVGRYFWGGGLAFIKRTLRNLRCAVLHAHGEMRPPIEAQHQQYVRDERHDRRAWYHEDRTDEWHPTQQWVDAREQEGYGLIVVLSCCELNEPHPTVAPVLTKSAYLISSLQESSAFRRNHEPDRTYFALFAPGGQMLRDQEIGATQKPPFEWSTRTLLGLISAWLDRAK